MTELVLASRLFRREVPGAMTANAD